VACAATVAGQSVTASGAIPSGIADNVVVVLEMELDYFIQIHSDP
jgi:hypothetical protein